MPSTIPICACPHPPHLCLLRWWAAVPAPNPPHTTPPLLPRQQPPLCLPPATTTYHHHVIPALHTCLLALGEGREGARACRERPTWKPVWGGVATVEGRGRTVQPGLGSHPQATRSSSLRLQALSQEGGGAGSRSAAAGVRQRTGQCRMVSHSSPSWKSSLLQQRERRASLYLSLSVTTWQADSDLICGCREQ